ncbi:MAG: heavy metal-associated domain-containing protein [Bacteroidota bacterium]
MKKNYLLSILVVFLTIGLAIGNNSVVRNHQSFTKHVTNPPLDKIILVFKVSGLSSESEARAIDEFLKARPFIISSTTDFKAGLCKVETDNITNKAKIIEAICYAGKQFGKTITVELIDNNID